MNELFLNLSKDKEKEIIRHCFVTTKNSIEADAKLERLLTEITDKIRTVDTREGSDVRLTQVVQDSIEASISQTVLIVGHIGAGKSTYLDRFFELVLPSQLKKKTIVVRLDLEHAQPNPREFTDYLHREFIKALKFACFKTDHPEFEKLSGAFSSFYDKRKKGEYKYLYKSDLSAFNTEFGKSLLEMEEKNHEQYIRELLSYCNLNLGRLVCVVLDNVDHHENEIQTRAFLSAKWLSGLGKMLCILPLRDSTYWQASVDGPFHTRNQTTLYLPRPPLADVLQARFKYAELQLDDLEKKNPIVINSLHGFRVKVNNAKQLFQCFHRMFGRELKPNLIIRGLSGGNIREALRIFYSCITSPHMNLDRLLAAYLCDGNFRLDQKDLRGFEKAAILGDWQCYKSERNRTVPNLLCFPKLFDNSPLMGLRVLERLYDLRADSQAQAKGFETLEDLVAFFELMAVPPEITDRTILALINSKLVEPYNLSVLTEHSGLSSTQNVHSIAISDSGRLLRYWARRSSIYGLEMIQDMEVYDEAMFNDLLQAHILRFEGFSRKNYVQSKDAEKTLNLLSRQYLGARDKDFISVPADPIFSTQTKLDSFLLNWTSGDDDDELI